MFDSASAPPRRGGDLVYAKEWGSIGGREEGSSSSKDLEKYSARISYIL